MHPFSWWSRWAALGLATAAVGCGAGDDGLPRREVSGTVTFRGQPLETGTIQFQPEGSGQGAAVSAGGLIEGGAYRIGRDKGPVPGSYKVLIFSPEESTTKDGQPPEPGASVRPPRERIPAKYNSASTLTAKVVSDGPNVLDFDLGP